MYIRDNGPYKYGGFEIDTDAIGKRTIKPNEIALPFTGDLPLPYKTATMTFVVSPETCMISITAERDGKPSKTYFVGADKEEVADILHDFFYVDLTDLCISREDNGLSSYWNGALQTEYDAWCNLSREPERIIAILQQLTAEQRKELYQDFRGMEAEDNRAGDPHD